MSSGNDKTGSETDYICSEMETMLNGKYIVPAFGVDVERDVVYRTASGYWTEGPDRFDEPTLNWTKLLKPPQELELRMDIYTPEGDISDSRPLLLMMHGGSFLFGNKNEKGQTEWCRHFASLGYVAASIDYRMGFHVRSGGLLNAEARALKDARAALKFLLGREDLKADPERVFVAGTSAGGALALGLAYGRPAVCRIRAVGDLWGYVRNLSILENARVPIVSFQSIQDPVVPYEKGYPLGQKLAGTVYGTKAVFDKAVSLGIPCDHVPCPENGHRLHLDRDGVLTPRFNDIRDRLTTFFAEVMAGC